MKIRTQLKVIAITIGILASCGFVTISLNSTKKDTAVVNYSGVVRGASQRAVKLELVNQPNDELIGKIESIIQSLINGNSELGLPKTTDSKLLSKLEEVKTSWGELKTIINQARQNNIYDDTLVTESEEFFELTNELVFTAQEVSQQKYFRLELSEFLIFGIELAIIVGIMIINQRVGASLSNFTHNVAVSSSQIAASMEEQERIISEQAGSVNETTTTVE